MTEAPADLPDDVAEVLAAAGWVAGRRDDERASDWGFRLALRPSRTGRQHALSPAAAEALALFGGLSVDVSGPGSEVVRTPFVLDPDQVAATAATLGAFADVLGAPLFPLGHEDGGVALLAIDGTGRVFALDHTAEWFLGGSISEALTTLVRGRRPPRVRVDGTWRAPTGW